MPSVPVVVYTKRWCAYCVRAKALLERRAIPFDTIDVSDDPERRAWLVQATGRKKLPQIFIRDRAIGGFDELAALDRRGELRALVAGEDEGSTG